MAGWMVVFGPQSVLVLLLFVAAFAGLAYVLAGRRHLALRAGAGAMAFVVATVFGMALVNKFYDYYQTWGDIFDDLAGRPPGAAALPPGGGLDLGTGGERARKGLLVNTPLAGARSEVDRTGLVYLPPQYFQPRYARLRFPVLELFHGSPGQPGDWQTGLHVVETYRGLLDKGKARPAILVMPNVNGSQGGEAGSQCLDQPGGVQNDTYLTLDVQADVQQGFRALPPGPHWGVAGYSEGGFCAANLALRHPEWYGLSGVMSGYFQPLPERGLDPFRGDPQARLANDPLWLAGQITPGAKVPAFWLMAGQSDRGDLQDARLFQSVLGTHGQHPALVVIPRARHTFAAWNPALPKLLTWATARLGVPVAAPPPASAAPVTTAPVTTLSP